MAPLAIRVLALLWLSFSHDAGGAGPAEPRVQVSYSTITIPTYPYADYLELQHSDPYNMDYYRLNWSAYEASGPSPVAHSYQTVVLENAWLRLTILPELGGRLYGVTDLATGEELLYQNPVIKPTHWGPPEQGWWLAAGGLEWCLPVEEHGYEWGLPWAYSVTATAEGAAVSLWDSTAADRVRARVTVFLPADQAAFTLAPRLENPTAAPVSFKFWHNAMLAPGAANTVGHRLRFVLPIDQVTVHSRGDDDLPGAGQAMSWPVYDGTDYSVLGNWRQWLGFFARPSAREDWVGVYAEGVRRGVARVFPHQIAAGAKGFGMGWSQAIDPDNWTDDGSTYVELHGGPAATFWDSTTLGPGRALEWTETWLPVRDLPALSYASAEAAVGLASSGSDLEAGVVLPAGGEDVSVRLWRRDGCSLLWRGDDLALAPGETFTQILSGLGVEPGEVALGVLDGGRLLALSGDLSCPAPSSWIEPLSSVQTSTTFAVSWTGSDPAGVAAGYDVQVRVGDSEAPWSPWLADTPAAGALFEGQPGQTYTFRSRVRDLFDRWEAWPLGPWDDSFTTVLLEPAPVLITSAMAARPACLQPGDPVLIEITLNNTGNLSACLDVSNPLPDGLELLAGPWISPSLPPPALVSGTVTWNGTLAAGQTGVVIGYTAHLPGLQLGQAVTDTVWIDSGDDPLLERHATLWGCARRYLPLVLKSA